MKQLIKKDQLSGLGVCIALALIASRAVKLAPSLGSTSFAIIMGIIAGNTIARDRRLSPGIVYAEKKLLPIAIMLLGVTLNIGDVFAVGGRGVVYILIIMSVVIISSIKLGKVFGFTREFSLLLGAGNAVCGSSAIAAASPIVGAKEDEVGISVAVVNLMGTIFMFVLPVVAIKLLHLTEVEAGALIGGSLQSVGQVAASGGMIDTKVQAFATLFKMMRVVMLGGVILLYSYILKKEEKTHQLGVRSKIGIPPFIIGFFILCAAGSIGILPEIGIGAMKVISKWAMLIAMAGIGMRIKLEELIKEGPKALLAGTILTVIQITTAVTLIKVIL